MRQEALKCFGLRNPPQYRVSVKNPNTLAEALNTAIKFEGRDDTVKF